MSSRTHAWVDGVLVDAAAPALRVTDPGFAVGDGVFTTTIVQDGRVFALDRHLDRLIGSAVRIGLPAPDAAWLRAGVHALLEADAVRDARLRVSVTPASTVVVHGLLAPPAPAARVVTLPWPRNEHGALAGVKSLSFGEWAVARRWVAARGADEGLFLTTAGNVSEGSATNVFCVVDGALVTPPLADGCLPGIVRQLVCELIAVREVSVPADALGRCSEAFLTSSLRRVQPVAVLAGRTLPAPGPATASVAAMVAEAVADLADAPGREGTPPEGRGDRPPGNA